MTQFLVTRNDGYNKEAKGILFRSSLKELVEYEIEIYNKFLKDRPFEHTVEIQEVLGKKQYSKVLAKIVNGKQLFSYKIILENKETKEVIESLDFPAYAELDALDKAYKAFPNYRIVDVIEIEG